MRFNRVNTMASKEHCERLDWQDRVSGVEKRCWSQFLKKLQGMSIYLCICWSHIPQQSIRLSLPGNSAYNAPWSSLQVMHEHDMSPLFPGLPCSTPFSKSMQYKPQSKRGRGQESRARTTFRRISAGDFPRTNDPLHRAPDFVRT